MFEKLKEMPPGIDGVKAVGTVSKNDYINVLEPLLEEARQEGRHVRFLFELGPDFESLEPSAALEDAKVGLRYLRLFDACAIVTDVRWIRESIRLAAFLMPCPVRVFGNKERAQAVQWLSSHPEKAALAHRMLPESGVMLIEVDQPVRAQDFDAMAATADAWIEAHGSLAGVVVHLREFPGWENLSSLVRHVRFVHDHHRKVKRVAFAVDQGNLAKFGPGFAEHFVKAEVKAFGYDQLADAVAWAGASAGRTRTDAN